MTYIKPEFTDEVLITIGEAKRRAEFASMSEALIDRIKALEETVAKQSKLLIEHARVIDDHSDAIENIQRYLESL